jgi:Tfp pilus assembly protein PilF
MKLLALATAMTVALTLPAVAQEWSGRGRVQGVVKDEEGKGIAGARVTLRLGDSGPDPITTNAKGRWTMLGLAHGDWTVIIEAPGHVGSEGAVKVYESGPGQSLDVTLRKATVQEQPAADPAAEKRAVAVEMLKKGNALNEQKQYAAARAEYERALADLPVEHHAAVLRAIAGSWYAEGKTKEAIAAFEKALELAPQDPELLQELANVLVGAGREAEAQTYIARLPQGTRVNPDALLNAGITAYNAGDLAKALTYFERVVSENPDRPDGYYYRGLVHLNRGDNGKARADFEKLVAMAPDSKQAGEAREFLKHLEQ